MKTAANENGFGALGVIIVVMVVAIIGASGFMVIARQKDDRSVDAAQNTAPKLTDQTDGTETPKEASRDDFITIEEWNVRFPIGSVVADAEYAVSEFGIGIVNLSTTGLRKSDCDLEKGGAGFIKRFKENEMNSETKQAYASEYPDAVKVGEYFYAYDQNPAYETCSKDSAIQAKVDAARAAFKQGLTEIESL